MRTFYRFIALVCLSFLGVFHSHALVLDVFTSQQTPSCLNATDGWVTIDSLQTFGATGPYVIRINTTPVTFFSVGDTVFNLTTFNYTITVIDLADNSVAFEIVNFATTGINTGAFAFNASCFGFCDGSASLAVAGGSAPYTFIWDDPGAQTTQVATGLCAGRYHVTVTDNNGCSAIDSADVFEPTQVIPNVFPSATQCVGSTDGAATAVPSGGTGTYTAYAWDSNASTTATATGYAAGTYTVTVTDSDGCTNTETFVIGSPPALGLNFNITSNLCFGQSNGSIITTPSGGTGAYTYNWFDGPTTQNRNNLAAGTYTLTLTDNNGCTLVDSARVDERPQLFLNINVTANNDCFGDANGSIDASVSGGTGPTYNFLWSETTAGTGTNTTISNLTAGTYTVTFTDNFGCTIVDSATITEPTQIVISVDAQSDPTCFGGNDGSISISATGGTVAVDYAYLWSAPGNPTTPAIAGLTAGTYTVTVTDDNNCTATQAVTLNNPGPILPNVTTDSVTCRGGNDGSATAAPTGGDMVYTYAWSVPGNTPTIASLTAGTYTVTVTDGNGCTGTETFLVGEPATAVSVNFGITDNICFGGTTGAITTTVTGGIAPYTFNWFDGPTVRNRNNLAAGTYTLTVTDNIGCTVVDSAIVDERPEIVIALSKVDNVCAGEANGSVTANISQGTPGYSFDWSNLTNGTGNTSTISNLTSGTYTITVTDAFNCTKVDSITVNEPSGIDIVVDAVTNPLCNGDNNGFINLSISGGTPALTFEWNTNDNTEDISGLIAGSYTITVTDGNGCTQTFDTTLVDPQQITLVFDSTRDISCNGANDGFLRVQPSGGTGAYTYSWSTVATTRFIDNLSQGTYTVTVTDANGCTEVDSATVNEPNVISVNVAGTDASCAGVNDGAANAVVTGGTTPYTFLWAPNGQTTQGITGLGAGTFTVTVTDVNGCTATDDVVITQPNALSVNITGSDLNCKSDNSGAALANVLGGTFPYTFLWSDPAAQTTNPATNLAAGPYTVTVTDNNGCSSTASVTLTEPDTLVASIPASTPPTCNGVNDGTATASQTGGTGPYTYAWSTTPTQTTITATTLGAGTYTVTVTDNNSCTDTSSVTIVAPPAVVITLDSLADVSCNGANDGYIELNITGGTIPYTYTWNIGPNSPINPNLGPGAYDVTVTDNNGCFNTANFNINEPGALTLDLDSTDASCFDINDGTITTSVGGGTPAYTFNWSDVSTAQNRSNLAGGVYTVTVTDNNGCTIVDSIRINQSSPIIPNLASYDVSCGNTNDGAAAVNPSGGAAPYTFLWGPGNPTGQGTDSISGLTVGNYGLTLSDNNGCDTILTITINQQVPTFTLNDTVTDVSCNAGTNGNIDLIIAGGVPPFTYNWNPALSNSPNQPNLVAGTYDVTVSDNTGCSLTGSYTVNEPAPLSLNPNITDESCFPGNDGAINLVVTGGTSPYNYIWDPALSNSPNQPNLTAGSYKVTVIDANSCNDTATYVVNQLSNTFTIALTPTDISCNGAADGSISVTVNPPGGYTFQWNGGLANSANPAVTAPGTYTVTVTDTATGCIAIDSATVNEPTVIQANLSVTSTGCSGTGSGNAKSTPSGGNGGPYTFNWGPGNPSGQGTDSIFGLTIGNYSVTVTDVNSCTSVEIFSVGNATSNINPNETILDASCFGECDGSITLNPSNGVSPYFYNWADAAVTTPSRTGLCAGAYTVTITGSDNCDTVLTVNVGQPDSIFAALNITPDTCVSSAGGARVLSVTNGSAPYTFNFSGGVAVGADSVNSLLAGGYDVTITDANGCTQVQDFVVPNDATFSVDLDSTDVSCNGLADGSIVVNVIGGTSPVTYDWTGGLSGNNPTGVGAGTYTITVTDANGCGAIQSITVNAPTEVSVDNIVTNGESCAPGNDGNAKAFVSGGTPPYTYTWPSPGVAFGDSASNYTASVGYLLTVTDANGCSKVEQFDIGSVAAFTVNRTVTDATCGNSDGAISITLQGATNPITYNWNDIGVGTANRTGLAAGIYGLTVTDGSTCSETAIIDVKTSDAVQIDNILTTDESCNPGMDGTATTVVSGGTTPFTFNWSVGTATTPGIAGLAAGVYAVTVTDANGCTDFASFQIDPGSNIADNDTVNDVSCFGGSDGSISLSPAGGVAPYTYNWAPVSSTAPTITGLSAGGYLVTITDNTGCSTVESYIVAQPLILISSFSVTVETCVPGNDGTAAAFTNSGTPPYTYNWGSGNTNVDNVGGLSAGTYSMTITDANACTRVFGYTIPPAPAITVSATSTPATCGNNDGTITLTTSGGANPLTYDWSDMSLGGANPGNVAAGTYTVTVTDGNGCTDTETVNITTNGSFPINETVVPPTCNGDCDGSITLSPTGGTSPYTYLWDDNSSDFFRTGLCDGSYDVTVTDNTGCSTSQTIVVTEPLAIAANITGVDESCTPGGDGSASTAASGGTGAYTYLWSFGGATTSGITGLTAGRYTVTITDANACTAVDSIDINSGGNIVLNEVAVDPVCNGDCNGSITLNPSGGNAPYTFLWDDNSSNSSRTALCDGNYAVTVTDNSGCSTSTSFTLTEPAAIAANFTNVRASCFPGMDGSITSNPTGGTNPYTFLWSEAGATTPGITGLIPGTYTVTITDNNGCTHVESTSITNGGNISQNGTVVNTSCFGSCDGSITLSPSGGADPNYFYQWDDNSTLFFRAGLCAGSYSVTVTNSFGCSVAETYIVGEPDSLEARISSTNESCSPGGDGTASTSAAGGTAPYTYVWNPGGATTSGLSSLTQGTYRVTITDNNGCSVVDSTTVGTGGNLALNETLNDASCFGICDGSISLAPSGGVSPYTYLWDDNSSNSSRTGLCAGSYDVTVTDNTGCSTTANFTINEPAELLANTSATDESCSPGTDGTASTAASGGTAPYTYLWSPGGAITPGLSSLTAGTYRVTITDNNGCTVVDSSIVGSGANIAVNGTTSDASCNGICDGSISLSPSGGVSPYTFLWDDNTTNSTRNGLCDGSYDVTVTDNTGCSTTANFTINEPAELLANTSATDESCSPGNDGTASTAASGGTAPYTYIWSPGGTTTPNLSALTAGTYRVTITDNNGCTVVDSSIVGTGGNIALNETINDASCNGVCDGSINLAPSGGTSPYTFLWDDNSTGSGRTGLCAGSYDVTVTDNTGCSRTSTLNVQEPDPLLANGSSTPESCNPGTDGTISTAASGGTAPYTYLWTPGGATTPGLSGLTAGDYTVTLTDQNGCSVVETINVGSIAPFTVSSNVVDASCNGLADGSISVTVTGNVGTLVYNWSDIGIAGPTRTGLAANNYDLTITDNGNSCSSTENYIINQPAAINLSTTVVDASCVPGNDGSIDLTVSGGSTPYTYVWDNGAAPVQDPSNLSGNVYNVTVTDNNGCTATTSATVGGGAPFTVNIATTNPSCPGSNDGTATVTVVGATNPLTYDWTGGLIGPNPVGISVGTYTLTVTDASGCSEVNVINIQDPPAISASTGSINTSSCTICDGKAYVSGVTGGTGTIQFNWLDNTKSPISQTADTARNLCPGVYFVALEDQNGCVDTLTATVSDGPAFPITVSSTNQVCAGTCDGTATVSSACIISLDCTVEWQDASSTIIGTSPSISNLCPGDYFVTVRNINTGCEVNDVVTILPATPISPNLTTADDGCTGLAVCQGYAVAKPSGGASPYTFDWAGPNTTISGVDSISSLCAGNYSLTITDANGCDTIVGFTIAPKPTIITNASSTNETCAGLCDGTASVNPVGGQVPYTYAWSNNAGNVSSVTGLCNGTFTVTITDAVQCDTTVTFNIGTSGLNYTLSSTDQSCNGGCDGTAEVQIPGGTTGYSFNWAPAPGAGQGTAQVSALCVGKYLVTITLDATGCSAVDSVTIDPSTPILPNESSINESCANACDGIARVAPTGGVGTYTYVWTPTPPNNQQGNSEIRDLCAGTYTVQISDAAGCDTNITFNIGAATAIVSNIVGEDQQCGNTIPCEGRAFVSPTGGNAPYTYQWSLGVITSSPDTAINLCNGKYFVTISDANSCSIVDSVTIGGPAPIDTAFTVVNSTCNICDGSITVVPSGGTAPYTYNWTDASSTSIGTTDNVSNLCSGIYFVEITDALGCSASFARSLSDDLAESVTVSKTDVNCFNGSDGTATANFVCTDAPCQVEWFDGAAQSIGITTATASNLTAGTYFVEVTNNSGCKAIESVTITQPTQLFINTTVSEVSCASSCDGSISLALIGGNSPYTFNWSPSPGSGQGTASISGLCAVDYTVTISDANGCDSIMTINVGSPDPLTANFTSIDASCNQSDGFINAVVSGGTVAFDYQYQWYDGANNLLAGQSAPSISNLAAGTYVLEVTDDNNCTQRFTTVLGSTNSPTITVDSIVNVSCFGGSDGEIFISASGANSPFTYSWLGLGQTSEDVANLAAGTYTVQVTNSLGCTAAEVIQITAPTAITANFATTNADCGQCNGAAEINVSGGTGSYTYLWSNGSTADTTANLCGGAHSVRITDSLGCTETFNFTINTNDGPSNALVRATAESCAGANDGTVTVTPIGGTPPYTYLWLHTGANTNTLNNLGAGTYFLLIADVSGCSRNVEVIITSPTELMVTETVVPSSCGPACDGSIALNVNGGVGPYSYSWSNAPASDTNFLGGLCAGIYNVTVTDANGCSEVKTISLPNSGNPTVANPTVSNVTCYGSCDGSLLSNLTAGPSLSYQWLNSDGQAITRPDVNLIGSACAGDYILEVTSLPSGCKSYANVSVTEPDSIILGASVVSNISCAGECDGEIFISTAGGNLLFDYSWDNGQDGIPIRNLCAGFYTVTATDANGCSAVTSVTLDDPPALILTLNSQTTLNCSSDCDAEADVTASGGTAPYTFNWDGGQTGNNPTDLCFGPNVLTVTDATGCIRDLTVNIAAIDTVVTIVPSKTLYCDGDSIELNATVLGSTVTSSGWYLEDTTTLFTATSDTTIIRPIGDYTFFMIATNGSCDDTTEYTFTVAPNPMVMVTSPVSIYKDEVASFEVSGEQPSYLYNWSPSTNLSDSTIAEPIASPRENRTYVLTVTDTNGCQYMDSVLVIYNPDLGIPSGISPNGDGKNDVWNINVLEEFPNAVVQVFNRWGELMYEQRNGYKVPWDGTYKGDPLPVGTYYYVIDLKSDRFEPVTGPITIVK